MLSPVTQNFAQSNPETYGIAHLLESNEAPDANQTYIVKRLIDELQRVAQAPQPSSIPTPRSSSIYGNSNLSPIRSIFLPAYPNLRHRADFSLRVRKKVNAYKSILHPIRRVPIFLWSYIFHMMIDEGDADQIDMVGYSHVCSKWRTSIIGTPEIWRQVRVRVDRNVEEVWDVGSDEDMGDEELHEKGTLVEIRAGETLRDFTQTIMRRSAGFTVDVDLHYEDEMEMDNARPVFDSFEERERWRSLTTGVVGFSEIFSDAFQLWESLERVEVTQKGDALLEEDTFGEFSLISAYRLRHLRLEWNGTLPLFTRSLLPWSKLHNLSLDITYCTVGEHLSILSHCSALQNLSIGLTTAQIASPIDPHFLERLRDNRIMHSRIHTFSLTVRNMSHTQLLNYISFPSLEDFTIKLEYAPKGWFFMPRGSRDKRGGRLHEVVAFLNACSSEQMLKSFEFWTRFNMPWRDIAVMFDAMPAVEEMSMRIGNDGNYVSNIGCDVVEDMIGSVKEEIEHDDTDGFEEQEDNVDSQTISDYRSNMSPTPTPSEADSGFEDTTIDKYNLTAKRRPRFMVSQATAIDRKRPLPALSRLHIHGKFIQLPMVLLVRLVGDDCISIQQPVCLGWYEDVVTLDFDVVTKKLEVVSANVLTKAMVKEFLDMAEEQAFPQ